MYPQIGIVNEIKYAGLKCTLWKASLFRLNMQAKYVSTDRHIIETEYED